LKAIGRELEPSYSLLYLSGVTAPPTQYTELKNLKEISFRDNQISHIEYVAFDYVVNLVTLDLSGNLITELDHRVFLKLLQLKNLILNRNHLFQLQSDLFSTNIKLEFINLNNNLIEIILVDFEKMVKIKKVLGFDNVCADFYLNLKDMKKKDLNELVAQNCSEKAFEKDFFWESEEDE
jgi:Leucine-rich repeat (LRR) protein